MHEFLKLKIFETKIIYDLVSNPNYNDKIMHILIYRFYVNENYV